MLKWLAVGILIAGLICLPVILLLRKKKGVALAPLAVQDPLAYAPNSVMPVYVDAPNATTHPGETWCKPFQESTFQGAYSSNNVDFAKCVTSRGNAWFEVRKIGAKLKRNKIIAVIK